jgi:hypothetical protein
MTPSEIIRKDAERMGYDADIVLRKVAKLVKSGAGLLLQEGNSLLLLIAIADNNAELHLYTADSPLNLSRALKVFIEKIRASDLNAVYGSGDVPQLLKMLNKFGVETMKSDLPNYRWMAPV